MSFIYLQEQEEVSSGGYCWDTDPCALLNSTSMPDQSLLNGNEMDAFLDFQFGMMSAPLMEHPGGAGLMSYVEVSHVRISAAQEKGQESQANEVAFGKKCFELSMRFNQDTCSLKTHHCLWVEDLDRFSVTLPPWGMMRDGVFWGHLSLEVGIYEKDVGCWPTPLKEEGPGGMQKKLTDAVAIMEGFKPRYYKEDGMEDRQAFIGKLNPTWVEWLMGWPMGWTDVSIELGMDKFQLWQQQHGVY